MPAVLLDHVNREEQPIPATSHEDATADQMSTLRSLAVRASRTIPRRTLTAEQADILIRELKGVIREQRDRGASR